MGRVPSELAQIAAEEWAEIEAFDAVEPIGGLHAEILAAHVQALLATAHMKRTRPFSASEFMVFQPRDRAVEPDLAAALKAALDRYNERRLADG